MLTTTKIAIIGSLLWTTSGLYFALTAAPAKTETFSGKVVKVVDGDTLDVERSPDVISRIRLACVDAPEKAQAPYGAKARTKLIELAMDKRVSVKSAGTDQYGRVIGKVEVDGRSVNLALVESGHAAVYTKYLKPCPEIKPALVDAESQAKTRKLGLWQQETPVMPWDWRKR